MFGIVFERQVAMLFQGLVDKSFHVSKKFVFSNKDHKEKCEEVIKFLKNKIT